MRISCAGADMPLANTKKMPSADRRIYGKQHRQRAADVPLVKWRRPCREEQVQLAQKPGGWRQARQAEQANGQAKRGPRLGAAQTAKLRIGFHAVVGGTK